MDPFQSVLGNKSNPANNLDAPRPSDMAQRKLEDACRGLGSGIPNHALGVLQQYADKLERPLIEELKSRLVSALVTKTVDAQGDSLRLLLDVAGIRSSVASCLAAQPGKVEVPTVHIIPDAEQELEGQTAACGLVLDGTAGRVKRGQLIAARARYNRPFYHLHACPDCLSHLADYPQADEAPDYPIFEPETLKNWLESAERNLDAALVESLDGASAESALQLADEAVLASFVESASQSVDDKTVKRALEIGDIYPVIKTTLETEHELNVLPETLGPSSEEWQIILAKYMEVVKLTAGQDSLSQARWVGLMELPREIAQIVLTNAALVSGKEAKLPALPGQTIASEAAPEIVTDKDKAASKRKKIKQQIAHT